MNILIKAINEIKWSIPQQILTAAFKDPAVNIRRAPISIDEMILNKVIRPRVLYDADLVGGQHMLVSLAGVAPAFSDTYSVVFEVPAELISYRTIISALSVGYLPYSSSFNAVGGIGNANPQHMTDLGSVMTRLSNSHSSIPAISNATVELIGPNTILIRDMNNVTSAYQLRCIVGNEENLNNLSVRAHLSFSKLCVFAVKAYIYNTLIVQIDQAQLSGGQELGAFKSKVEEYADANENYQIYLEEKLRPMLFMNDTVSYQRFIQSQISPGL